MHLLMLVALLVGTEPIRLAAPKMQSVNIDEKTSAAFAAQLTQQLALQPGVRVTTPEEISSLLGLERQKQLLGCAENECVAELAGALGVDAVVLSSLSLLGKSYVLNVKVIGAKDGRQLAVVSERVADADALLDAIGVAAKQLALQLKSALHREAEVVAPTRATPVVTSSRSASKAWIPAAVGAAAVIGGGVAFGLSKSQEAQVRAGYPADVDAAMGLGRTEQATGLALFVGGGVAFAGAALWYFFFDSSPVAATAYFGNQSAGISVQLRWP